VARQFSGYG
jgi:ubiquitin C-terminal hydrolase